MVLLALWSALEAPPSHRSALLLLPPSSTVPTIRAETVEVALTEALRGQPAIALHTLDAAQRTTLQADPGCAQDRACLRALAGPSVDALLLSRVQVHNGVLSIDLTVLDAAGQPLQRVAFPITAATPAQVAPALPALMLPLDRDAADYARAVAGDEAAAARLRARSPNSPWTQALAPQP